MTQNKDRDEILAILNDGMQCILCKTYVEDSTFANLKLCNECAVKQIEALKAKSRKLSSNYD
jgi:hypothetical protein